MSFGENLKRIRTEKGISQGELAQRLGMHASHVSRYERDQTAPSIEVLKKIAEALTVSADELLYGSTDKRSKSIIKDNDLLQLFGRVQQLDKQQLTCIKSMLGAYIFQADTKQRLES